jgi:DNA-binding response OmpR family regulator
MSVRSILICDDETELTAELAEFMEATGWDVRTATSAIDAEALLRGGPAPDCLLTDLRIADFDGADLIELARRLPPRLQPRVIGVITGHLEDGVGAADLRADVLHIKPIDPEALSADLARLIDDAMGGSRSPEAVASR